MPLRSPPRRVMAWLASAATPMATSARSAMGMRPHDGQELVGAGAVDRRQQRRALRGQREHPLAPVGDLLAALEVARASRGR